MSVYLQKDLIIPNSNFLISNPTFEANTKMNSTLRMSFKRTTSLFPRSILSITKNNTNIYNCQNRHNTNNYSTTVTTKSSSTILLSIDKTKDQEEGKTLKDELKTARGDEFNRYYGTGRRKTSSARVWVKAGCGEFIVNDKPLWDYFQSHYRQELLKPFLVSKTGGLYDVWCTVKGGGISGQAGAVRLGISRALEQSNPTLRASLKKGTVTCCCCYNNYYYLVCTY